MEIAWLGDLLGWIGDVIIGAAILEHLHEEAASVEVDARQGRDFAKQYRSEVKIHLQFVQMDQCICLKWLIAHDAKLAHGSGDIRKPLEHAQADLIEVVIHLCIDRIGDFLVDAGNDFVFENEWQSHQADQNQQKNGTDDDDCFFHGDRVCCKRSFEQL